MATSKATIKDVAKLANVSVATVSRVLNGSPKVSTKAKDAVLKARDELGFFLNANARALAHQNSDIVGLVVADVSDPYFGEMVKSVENTAVSLGAKLLISQGLHSAEREKQAIENLLSYQCKAYIVHALAMSDEDLENYLKLIPSMVLVNRIISGFENRCINIDNQNGSFIAVEELIKNGHQHIAYVGSSHQILDAKQRVQGYIDALTKAHLQVNESLIFKTEPSLEGGEKAAIELLKIIDKITAIATYNDAQAAAIISVLTQHGIKIPDRISIVGFDNLFLSKCLNPPLTTVVNPVENMAHEAVMLSLSISNNEPYSLPTFDVELIKRNSIKDLNRSAHFN